MKKALFALFVFGILVSPYSLAGADNVKTQQNKLISVTGAIAMEEMGLSLIHEHLLADFIGADSTGPERWNRDDVVERVTPYLLELKPHGVATFIECTPSYIGKDVELLKRLSRETGIQILTNTGYYGAVNNKFLPPHAFEESADQLAARWTADFRDGIDNTGIRPGFMKIGVDSGSLSELHAKLVRAAARTHLATGMTIASHTGGAVPALEQIRLIQEEGVHPSAFIWVHAQGLQNMEEHVEAARAGAWISLDSVYRDRVPEYVRMLQNLRDVGLLHRVLISHDAGWYSVGEPDGGDFRPFTDIFTHLLPSLDEAGFSRADIDQILVKNPAEAFAIRKRLIEYHLNCFHNTVPLFPTFALISERCV